MELSFFPAFTWKEAGAPWEERGRRKGSKEELPSSSHFKSGHSWSVAQNVSIVAKYGKPYVWPNCRHTCLSQHPIHPQSLPSCSVALQLVLQTPAPAVPRHVRDVWYVCDPAQMWEGLWCGTAAQRLCQALLSAGGLGTARLLHQSRLSVSAQPCTTWHIDKLHNLAYHLIFLCKAFVFSLQAM